MSWGKVGRSQGRQTESYIETSKRCCSNFQVPTHVTAANSLLKGWWLRGNVVMLGQPGVFARCAALNMSTRYIGDISALWTSLDKTCAQCDHQWPWGAGEIFFIRFWMKLSEGFVTDVVSRILLLYLRAPTETHCYPTWKSEIKYSVQSTSYSNVVRSKGYTNIIRVTPTSSGFTREV